MRRIGDILIDRGMITEGQLHEALKTQKESGGLLGEVLVDLGHITEDKLTQVKASIMGLKIIQIRNMKIHPKLISFIPGTFARRYRMIPAYIENVNGANTLYMAVADEPSGAIISSISKKLRVTIRLVLVTPSDLRAVLNQYYPDGKQVAPKSAPQPEPQKTIPEPIAETISIPPEKPEIKPEPVISVPAFEKKEVKKEPVASQGNGGKLNFLAAFEGESGVLATEPPATEPAQKSNEVLDPGLPFATAVPEDAATAPFDDFSLSPGTPPDDFSVDIEAEQEISVDLEEEQEISVDFEEDREISVDLEEEQTVDLTLEPVGAASLPASTPKIESKPVQTLELDLQKEEVKPVVKEESKQVIDPVKSKPIVTPKLAVKKDTEGEAFIDVLLKALEKQDFSNMQRAILKQTLTKKDARNALLMATIELLYQNGLFEVDQLFELIKKYVK